MNDGRLSLKITKRTHPKLLECMAIHYSQPKGFVGRNCCYAIYYDDFYFGHIVGGSTPKYLVGRDKVLDNVPLNSIINNIFYHVLTDKKPYPIRNFTTKILLLWEKRMLNDWYDFYGDKVLGFESLVELPRLGDCYMKAGYTEVGITKGCTCKRVSGFFNSDSWSGQRIWDTINLRPKRVFCKKVEVII